MLHNELSDTSKIYRAIIYASCDANCKQKCAKCDFRTGLLAIRDEPARVAMIPQFALKGKGYLIFAAVVYSILYVQEVVIHFI